MEDKLWLDLINRFREWNNSWEMFDCEQIQMPMDSDKLIQELKYIYKLTER